METKKVAVSPLYGVFRPVNIELGYIIHSFFQYVNKTFCKTFKENMNIFSSRIFR